jgi:hypothetical protein
MRTALTLLMLSACDDGGYTDPSRAFAAEVTGDAVYPEVVENPKTLGVVDTPLRDVNGTPIGVSCDTCHGPNPTESWAARPGEAFHTGVKLEHGSNNCASCHDEDRTKLHLADGTLIEFGDSLKLCGQCHGTQLRDFEHGAHGGMNGYWDRRQGPQVRQHCAACHAPHTPKYERVMPVHPPKDRYLDVGTPDGEHH